MSATYEENVRERAEDSRAGKREKLREEDIDYVSGQTGGRRRIRERISSKKGRVMKLKPRER